MPKKPQKPEKYITSNIKIEKFIPGGQAIATLADGKKIFLWGALPGEIITRAKVTREKSSYIEAIAVDIGQSSPQRITPKDSCYLSTSPWQILDFEFESTEKAALLQEIFRQHAIDLGTDIPYTFRTPTVDIEQNSGYYYRNKMEYALYYDHSDEQIHLAFHARGSHRKVPIECSSIERPEILAQAQTIIAELNEKKEDARKFQSLLLRCNQSGEVSGGLFENYRPHPQFPNLTDELFGITYSYSPNGFFQINLPVYIQALESIRNACNNSSQSSRVLDLYSGVGTIGLSVAPDAELTLVECDKSAYTEMVTNAQHVSIKTGNQHIHPVLAKSEEALEYIAPDQTVIVDPPRAGCRPEVIAKFLDAKPQTIIYLSCNPATQARDVKMLLEAYQIQQVESFNFFPRTPHIENLVILERKTPKH